MRDRKIQNLGLVAWEVMIREDENEDKLTPLRQYKLQKDRQDHVAHAASTNPDIMYYNKAMKAPESTQFKQEMGKELNDHMNCNHWQGVPRSEVLKGTRVLDMVWAM